MMMATSGRYGVFAFSWTATHSIRRGNHRVNCWGAQKGLHGHTIGKLTFLRFRDTIWRRQYSPFGWGMQMAWCIA